LAVDTVFLGANLLKVHEGGWMPLAVAASLIAVMLTWRRGAGILAEKAQREEISLRDFIPCWRRARRAASRGRPCS